MRSRSCGWGPPASDAGRYLLALLGRFLPINPTSLAGPPTPSDRRLEQRWGEGTRNIEGHNRNVSLEKDGTVALIRDLWTPIDLGADR
jgi:hypothetical protein